VLKSCYKKGSLEAGCDEAGRGCLAGPVFAAAVILPEDFSNPMMNDSKLINEKVRYSLRTEIQKEAIAWSVAWVSNEEIDRLNILRASIMAMHKALDKLNRCPQNIIVDGNRFYSYRSIPHTCIVNGDGSYMSIAAASVLAKTYRDDYMIELHKDFTEYRWNANKGYATKYHREAIREFGLTTHHRRSFRLYGDQLYIKF